jgi:hypothetical protein
MSITYSALGDFFTEEHGQLCDIIIPDTTIDHWVKFLHVIAAHYPYRFTFDDDETPEPIPSDPRPMLVFGDEGPWPGLSFDVDALDMRVLFLGPMWIEIDTWRTTITPDGFDALLALMRRIGDALERDVFMTPERRPDEAAVVYEHSKRIFRAPRHGKDSDGRVHRQLLEALTPALQSILAHSTQPSQPPRPLVTLQRELKQVEDALAPFDELTLQDQLTIDGRSDIEQLRVLLVTLVRDTADQRTAKHLASRERELTAAAARLRSTPLARPLSS